VYAQQNTSKSPLAAILKFLHGRQLDVLVDTWTNLTTITKYIMLTVALHIEIFNVISVSLITHFMHGLNIVNFSNLIIQYFLCILPLHFLIFPHFIYPFYKKFKK